MTIRTIFSILIILQSTHIIGSNLQIPEPPIKNYGEIIRPASAPVSSSPLNYDNEETEPDSFSDGEEEIYIDHEDEKKNDA